MIDHVDTLDMSGKITWVSANIKGDGVDIKVTDNYQISYDPEKVIIYCKGSLRLNGMDEYTPIVQLFNDVAESAPDLITINLQELEFLNSSGINVLSKFVIKVRQKEQVRVIVQGTQSIPWQNKSLKNLQRLMPSLQLEWH